MIFFRCLIQITMYIEIESADNINSINKYIAELIIIAIANDEHNIRIYLDIDLTPDDTIDKHISKRIIDIIIKEFAKYEAYILPDSYVIYFDYMLFF